MLPHFEQVQILYVHKYNFIEKPISLALHFRQVIAFDWLYIINT
jgi:hypothetical protein